MSQLRIVPLDDAVVLPGMTITLPREQVGSDTTVLLIPRQGQVFARVGVVADTAHLVKLSDHSAAVSVIGLQRGIPGVATTDADGVLRVSVDERPDPVPAPHLTRELEREYRAVVDEILELRGDEGRIKAFLRSITTPGALADTSGYSPDLSMTQKIQLLETLDVVERLKLALRLQQERLLPIGGLKQKVLAAHAAGLTEVIVPERNAADLDDVPREIRDHMTFHIIGTVDEVLARALEPSAFAAAA